jgi:hypothetical protein
MFYDVQNEFTTINCLNQAIQPEVVGPLFKKRGDGLPAGFLVEVEFGTSIEM